MSEIISFEEAVKNIGKKVQKTSTGTPKPFKSKLLINTIKGVIDHPYRSGLPAYTFEEDDSFVSAEGCVVFELHNNVYSPGTFVRLLQHINDTRKRILFPASEAPKYDFSNCIDRILKVQRFEGMHGETKEIAAYRLTGGYIFSIDENKFMDINNLLIPDLALIRAYHK